MSTTEDEGDTPTLPVAGGRAESVEELADRIPLSDSAGRYVRALGTQGVRELRLQGHRARVDQGFGDLSVADLRDGIAQLRPFEDLDRGLVRTQEERDEWWRSYGEEAAAVVGAEEELIERAREEHAVRAIREVERREVETPDPIAAIREVRGEEFADRVERRAAFLASGLEGRPQEQLQEETRRLRTGIEQRGGVERAGFEQLSRATALQFHRNLHNEELHLGQQGQQRALGEGGAERGI